MTGRLPAQLAITILLGSAGIASGEWPQILGPTRDGVYAGPTISSDWPAEGPRRLWSKKIGEGFAGPIVAAGRLVLFHRRNDREIVEAFDAASGKPLWRYDYPTSYRDDFGFDEGPRSVPVVVDRIIYTFGAEGRLSAVALEDARLLWSVDTKERFRFRKGFFGAAGSPVVEGGRVLHNVGGEKAGIVAFDAKTGDVVWSATDDEASYSSPMASTLAGKRVGVFYTRSGLVVVEPETGVVLHRHGWRSRSRASVNAATPLVVDDILFLSASYGTGATALRFDEDEWTELWSSDDVMSNHYATSVHRDGVLYGFHGRQEYSPSFRAVSLATGDVLWSEDRFGAGTVTLAGERLVIVRESGELLLAEASSERFRVLAKARLLPATIRAYPALSDGILYVRNETTLAAFDLRGEPPSQAARASFRR